MLQMSQGQHLNKQQEPETGPSEHHKPGASSASPDRPHSSHQSPQQSHAHPHRQQTVPHPPSPFPSVRPQISQNHVNPVPRQSVFFPPIQAVPINHTKWVPRAFPEGGARQSILGHPPIVLPDSLVHIIDKRDNLLTMPGRSNRPIRKSSPDLDTGKRTAGRIHSSFQEHGEPLLKKQRGQRAVELKEASACEDKIQQPPKSAEPLEFEEGEISRLQLEDNSMEQDRAAEVQGVGTSLKVTIQHRSESRAFNTSSEETNVEKEKGKVTVKFTCYICNVTCPDQQAFQTHMVSLDHQQRMMEIQRASKTLLPQTCVSLQDLDREGEMGRQRWCPTCQCHFCGDLIEHRRTTKHKLAKTTSRPFCTLCERHFRSPRKFVEHMKSPEHKQRVEELREEGGPEIMEELITVDAVGCFEGEDDNEKDLNEEEVPVLGKDFVHKDCIPVGGPHCDVYDPDTQYGTGFMVPVTGFLCKLCHKFYHESSARETHCKSFVHFQNLQKYNALKLHKKPHEDSLSDVSCGSLIVDSQELEHPSDSIQSNLNTSHIGHPHKRRRARKRHKLNTPNSKSFVSQKSSTTSMTHLASTGSNHEYKESGAQIQCSDSRKIDKISS